MRKPARVALALFPLVAACGGKVSTDSASVSPGHGSTATDGTGAVTLAEFGGTFDAAAQDQDALYVALEDPSAGGNPRILRIAKSDGAVQTVVSTSVFVLGLAVDANYVYYTLLSDGEVRRVAKLGGASEVLASGQNRPWGLVIDDASVYWASQGDQGKATGTVSSVPKAGGPVTTLASGQESATGIALTKNAVVWSNEAYGADNAEVRRIALDGSAPESAVATSLHDATALGVGSARISWTSGSRVFLAPLDGSPISSIETHGTTWSTSLQSATIDGAFVYYGDDSTNPSHGAVSRVPLGGGEAETVMGAPSEANTLVTGWMTFLLSDASNVYAFDYFANREQGERARIRVAPKPPTAL